MSDEPKITERSYYDKATIHIVLTVEIKFARGSAEARDSAIQLATEHYLNAGGVGPGGGFGAKAIKAEVQNAE